MYAIQITMFKNKVIFESTLVWILVNLSLVWLERVELKFDKLPLNQAQVLLDILMYIGQNDIIFIILNRILSNSWIW